jgi:NADH-quinone oxidoreductase subunit E
VYTAENRARIDGIVKRYPEDQARSAVLPALYLVQAQQGYITGNAMKHVADVLGITPADVEDVVTYYTMFFTKPVGRFVLCVCRTLSCAVMGAERVTEEICRALSIKPGETDASGTFTLIEVECLGACDRAPVIMVNDAWQERQRPEDVPKLLEDLRTRGEAALTGCHLVAEKR